MIQFEVAQAKVPAAIQPQIKLFESRMKKLGGALSHIKPKWDLPLNAKPRIVVNIVTDAVMKKINLLHRKKNVSTDVLSFSYIENNAPVFSHEPVGEIFISRHTAAGQARSMDHGLADELTVLAAHGALHIMGFDHETSQVAAKKMRQAEIKVLSFVGKNLPALTNRGLGEPRKSRPQAGRTKR